MRTIDADALKELFSEVIGHIAKKPEMNGNLEHMIRASAMVIQMIDDAPTVQPDTTTHDSIPAETGKNDGDGTSVDCISRTQAIDALLGITAMRNTIPLGSAIFNIKKLPSAQPERKTGHWVKSDIQRWYDVWLCSECGEKTDSAVMSKPRYKYCPMCGAKMREE